MRRIALSAILLCSFIATACVKTGYIPTAPGNGGGGGSTSGGGTNNAGSSGTSGSAGAAASAFSGSWASSTIAGLPLGTCSDVKWVITTQTDTSLSGTVTATCSSGVTVAANLTGKLVNDSTITIDANGTMTALGVPCPFTIAGTGMRQSNDSMKVDYIGTYCLGNVSGSETLRKFPNI